MLRIRNSGLCRFDNTNDFGYTAVDYINYVLLLCFLKNCFNRSHNFSLHFQSL